MVLQERKFYQHFDWLLVIPPVLLMIIGTLMIYNTTGTKPGFDTSDLLHDITFRQIVYVVAGLVVLFSLSAFDYRIYAAFRYPLYLLMIGLLAVVFILGQITHGAQRWIDLSFFQLQPSEPAKLIIVLVLAKFFADHEKEMSKWRTLAVSLAIVGLPIGMVYLQPDLGTALVLGFIWLVMVIAAGLSWRRLLMLAVIGVILLPLVWLTLQPYQRDRVMTFMNPSADPLGSGYNPLQAQIAIGSGGIWGLGLGSGMTSQLRYLRIRHTDFIFAVIGEELGFWGGVFIFFLFVFIIVRLLRAAVTSHSAYGRLVAVGFAAALFFQSFVNLGMNLGLMPVTGIPLPFVSSGGSSLVTYLMMLGIVESVLSYDNELRVRSEVVPRKRQKIPVEAAPEYRDYL
ncbi:MAG: rod shape-determining protein RodA [Anaerolineae bacterium]